MYIKELREWIKGQPDHAKLMVKEGSGSAYGYWHSANSYNVKIETDPPETLVELEQKIESHKKLCMSFARGK